MDSPADTAEPVAPIGGAAPSELRCASCGCALAGLADDARCPECGLAIAATRRGRLLRDADADWRGQLQTGAALVAIAPAIAIGFIVVVRLWAGLGVLIGADSAAGGPPRWDTPIGVVLAAGLLASGWWFLTHDEPDAPISARTHVLGLILRITSVGGFAIVALVWMVESALEWLGSTAGVGRLLGEVLRIPLGLLGLAHLVASSLFLSRFAARVPSEQMARRFRIAAWIPAIALVLWVYREATGLAPGVVTTAGAGGVRGWLASLLSVLVSLTLLAALCWYWFSGVWWWRQLRALQREALSPLATSSVAAGETESPGSAPPL